MTDVVKAESTLATPDDAMIGLEDFNQDDMVMPTIRINHDKGMFEDGLSGEMFPTLDAVLLGLIKQRVLWDAEVDEGSKGPLCRSYDFKTGYPDADRFPWKASNFDKSLMDADPTLPCESCALKDWGSHPKRDTPWCSEQHTFALLQVVADGNMIPALLTVQRSAIKPSKTYLTSFARSHTALYTVHTKVTLDHRKKGSVDYAVPKFIRADATNEADHPMFAQQYRQIREFVQTPRVRDDDADPIGSAPPTAAATPATSGTGGGAAPAPAVSGDDDDLPF